MTSSRPPEAPPGSESPERPKATRRRAVEGLPERKRLSPSVAALAIGAHVAIGFVLVQVLTFGHGLPGWLRFENDRQPEERLTYVTPKAPVTPPPALRQVPRRVDQPQLQPQPSAPAAQPAGVPDAPPEVKPLSPRDTGSGGTVGNGVGALDPNVRGVRPGYTDERVWRGTVGNGGDGSGGAARRGDRADNLDSIIAGAIMGAADSLDSIARASGKYGRKPGDWTKTDKNGRKWGWDDKGIRLGKYTLPNALLALLPMNAATAAGMSANPVGMAAGARINAASADIQRMSARGMGDAEFKRIVKEMDARHDTQRRERLRAPSASYAAPVKSDGKSDGKSSSSGQPSGR